MKKQFRSLLIGLLILSLYPVGQTGCGSDGGGAGGGLSFQLDVQLVGNGTVTSAPAGIDCGSDCTAEFDDGTVVVLTAAAAPGYQFTGWSGVNCSGTGTCTVTLNADSQVIATFSIFQITFSSSGALDGSSNGNTNGTSNVWIINADGTGADPLTELTALGANSFSPQWSPDNSRVAFVSGRALNGTDAANANDTTNIWVMNADGSNPIALTQLTANGADSTSPQWSPDGSQIVFDSTAALNGSDAANANFTQNIWGVNADGSGLAPLTQLTVDHADSLSPVFSPDGSQIVYQSSRAFNGTDAPNTNNVFNIWTMDANGSNSTARTQLTASGIITARPQWSPDGSMIVFDSSRDLNPANDALNPNGTENIWVMDADGSNPSPLTTRTANNADSIGPQWSPDGSQLVFISQADFGGGNAANANATQNVWVMDANGQNERALTLYTILNLNTLEPIFSPDGLLIAYSSEGAFDGSDVPNLNTSPNIFTMNADGSDPGALTQITADKTGSDGPQFSH